MITEAQMPYKVMRARERDSLCAQCESPLVIRLKPTRLECAKDPTHIGIESAWAGLRRRRELEAKVGQGTALELRQYEGKVSLTEVEAKTIITKLWPNAEDASPEEVYRAVNLCVTYQWNPLLGHVALAPFWSTKKKKYLYVTLIAIKATRLSASRSHKWTYLEYPEGVLTPRIMTDQEEINAFGAVDKDFVSGLVIIEDVATKARAPGYGRWPRWEMNNNGFWKLDDKGNRILNQPKGYSKGNSMAKMSFIRAERDAHEKLWPTDFPKIPPGAQVVADAAMPPIKVTIPPDKPPVQAEAEQPPEDVIEGEFSEAEEGGTAEQAIAAKKGQSENQSRMASAAAKEAANALVDLDWLKEQLTILQNKKLAGWTNKAVVEKLNKLTGGKAASITEAVMKLTKEQAEVFTKEIQDTIKIV